MLCPITFMDRGALALLEKLFGFIQVKDVTPLGSSQQYEALENLPDKVLYFPGDWKRPLFISSGDDYSRFAGGVAKC